MDYVYILYKKTNPHIPNSGYKDIVAIDTDWNKIADLYDSYPEYHYVAGVREPALILTIDKHKIPYVDEYMLNLINKASKA